MGPFICANPHCGRSFYGYPGNLNRYCSKRCNKRIHQIDVRTCETCKKQFEKRSSNYGRFCSMECAKPPTISICQICERSFRHRPSHKRKYCSKSCEAKGRTKTIEERFWSKVNKSGDCWIWSGAKNQNGYGNILYNGRNKLAHRVAYELIFGKILDDKFCLHSCDNPACVNPDHLRLGTQFDNVQDMHAKNRALKGYRGKSIRKKEWIKILEFYHHSCALCGKNDNEIKLVKDHFVSRIKGGSTVPENIWPLCSKCNQKKHDKLLNDKPPHAGILYG